jgi:hypothetical protein
LIGPVIIHYNIICDVLTPFFKKCNE